MEELGPGPTLYWAFVIHQRHMTFKTWSSILCFLRFLPLIGGKQFQAWYLPADKLARYPNHPQIKTGKDVYRGFTLNKKLFSGKEYEEGVNIRDTS